MSNQEGDSNSQFINDIRKGDMAAFEELFNKYYAFLCLVAEHIVRNPEEAEEIVSDVFVRLWKIRDKTDEITSVKGYLVKAVYNTSLNYLEQNATIKKLTDHSYPDLKLLAWDSDYPLGQLYGKEVQEILDQAINRLPDSCRRIFLMSRNDDMKYSDIADKLGISVNTVKAHMKIALSRLRESVKYYIAIFLFALLF